MTADSTPYPLGITLREGGANVAVYSERADKVIVSLFDARGRETQTVLPERTGHVFHGFVPGLVPGTRYGLRVDGPWDPANGLRFSPPRCCSRRTPVPSPAYWDNTQAVFGHQLGRPKRRSDTNGARHVALGVAIDRQEFDWGDHERPRIPLSETIIYEMHVKGFTKLMEWVPEEFRGTYAGLAHPAAVEYLKNLGVTAVELLPIHQFVQDAHLAEKGLRNYWGYNSIGFFAPH
ncbi:hypothetical protein ACRAWC_25000 [Leifsonia sp. L25]|uniref:hypothetical protein n=1 Tax=Leifsonia sp. L25 TaxID=3423957 RepID=UPI003D6822AD